MENIKVINKMNKFDWGLMFIPPAVSVIAALIVERGQGELMILPILLISSVFYSGIYLIIALCLSIFLKNKLAYRIVMAICAFPLIFFAAEYLLVFAMSFGEQPSAN